MIRTNSPATPRAVHRTAARNNLRPRTPTPFSASRAPLLIRKQGESVAGLSRRSGRLRKRSAKSQAIAVLPIEAGGRLRSRLIGMRRVCGLRCTRKMRWRSRKHLRMRNRLPPRQARAFSACRGGQSYKQAGGFRAWRGAHLSAGFGSDKAGFCFR